MTNKEIIIDGVDVSGCCYFDYENEGTTECDMYNTECEAQNRYYKQLQRKTAECEELNKENEAHKKMLVILGRISRRYKQALDDYKKTV